MTSTDAEANPLSQWQERAIELHSLVHPLLYSQAVQRLTRVTFLGVLSPRLSDVVDSPLWPAKNRAPFEDDSRFDHSLGVALIALDLARKFDFSERGQRFAVAWGLTHDVATWPLSHTSEPAFSAVTGTSARNLRAAILLGKDVVPERYHLSNILRDLDVDPSALVSLFEEGSVPADKELALFKQVVRSPLTPDTLEGIWRSGLVFGVPVAPPHELLATLVRGRDKIGLDVRRFPSVLEFWRSKADVYHRFINREDVIRWESAWSMALQRCCDGLSLSDSLELSEAEVIGKVKRLGMPTASHVVRYKEPQEYLVNGTLDALPAEPSVGDLWRVLRCEPVGSSHE